MALPLLLPIISILIIFFLAYLLYQRLRFKLPPGPRPLPVVGNLFDLKPVACRCFAEWAQVYGPIMSVWFGSRLNVIVSNTEMAKEVLKEQDQHLANRDRNRPSARFSRDGQDLIWADYGPHYVKVRKLCTLELFSPKRLEALRPIREDEVAAMVESIYRDCNNLNKKSLLLKMYLEKVALNSMTRVTFGKKFVNAAGEMDEQGREFKSIFTDGLKLGASLTIAEYIPWLRWAFPLEEEEFKKNDARRNKLTMTLIDEHTLSHKKSGTAMQHFVEALLTLKDEYDLSEVTVIGLLWDMIIAGMDTIAVSVEWAMAELVKNPRVVQKAQEELDRVIGSERVMTESDFLNLPYLHALAKEALRIHPPTPLMLPHKANTHVKIGGYDIPKGSVVQVNVWAIGRDPEVWNDPLEFRPERFLEEDVNMKGHDFRLLPFGSGRRVCPGAQLGINFVTSMLGHLLHHFSWSMPLGMKPEEIDMSETPGMIAFMKTPLQVVVEPRLPANLYKRVPLEI